MAFLLAGLGDPRTPDWIRGLAASFGAPPHPDAFWHDDHATISLALLGPSLDRTARLRTAGPLVAAALGRLPGTPDPSSAVLQAYAASGTAGLSRLRGDYIYALWDPSEQALFVGCDAVGLRAPAFVAGKDTFLLSTSATLLLRHPAVARTWDPTFAAHVLSGLWGQATPRTAFGAIRRMAGGQGLRVTASGVTSFEADRFAFETPEDARGDRRKAARRLGEALDDVLASDDNLRKSCIALSGGVDSCAVATALIERDPQPHAFSLMAPQASPGQAPSLTAVLEALPGMRHHPVLLTGDETFASPTWPLPDDPVCAGPIMQPGRVALLRAVRQAGFDRVYDGEGGDEVFDILWRPGDLVRDKAVFRLLTGLARRGRRRALVLDLAWRAGGPLSDLLLRRSLSRLRAARPWLRPSFWHTDALREAIGEALSVSRVADPRDRLPEVLGAHGRYWRVQELHWQAAGVEGRSPFLRREVVELVASLRPRVAVDLRHRKVLLRRLAASRVPPAIAWRPKHEPLSDWLIARWIAREENIAQTVAQVKASRLLAEHVDAQAFAAAALQAARAPFHPGTSAPTPLANALVEFGALADWISAIETTLMAG